MVLSAADYEQFLNQMNILSIKLSENKSRLDIYKKPFEKLLKILHCRFRISLLNETMKN